MNALTLQQMKDFIASGVTTAARFAIDPATVKYNLNQDGSLNSVMATVKSVDPTVLGIGFGFFQKQNNTPQDKVVIWDATCTPMNAPKCLALVASAPAA